MANPDHLKIVRDGAAAINRWREEHPISRLSLDDAWLSGANLSGANLSGAILLRADLRGADLSEADLSYADLSNADLSGTDLVLTNLDGANFTAASLNGARLLGLDLTNALGLTGLQLRGTSVLDGVRLPPNLEQELKGGGSAKGVSSGLRFDGVYQAGLETYWNYLRFYADGTFIDVGPTSGQPKQIASWFHRDSGKSVIGFGKYTISDDTVRFGRPPVGSLRETEYEVADSGLILKSRTRSDDYGGAYNYRFVED